MYECKYTTPRRGSGREIARQNVQSPCQNGPGRTAEGTCDEAIRGRRMAADTIGVGHQEVVTCPVIRCTS